MGITWKDAVTTVLAGGTGYVAYAKYQGWQSWLTSPRLGILALAAIGMAMCTFGSRNFNSSIWTVGLSALGGLAFLLILAGLITGSSLMFYALAADLLALWLLSTLRHVVA